MAETVSVGGAEDLLKALSTAKAGTTIKLAGGDYGNLSINAVYRDKWGRFDGEVTIRSADPKNPATFNEIFLRGVENLTFDGVRVDYTLPKGLAGDTPYHQSAIWVQETANITIRNSVIDGDVLDDPSSTGHGLPIARGLFVRDSSGILIENNEIQNFYRAAVFPNNSDVTVSGNDIHTIRSDGLNFSAVQGVVIEDNHIHDFTTVDSDTSHRDMIQFWTSGNTPSTNIKIIGNFLDSGGGVYTQSILMGNEAVHKGAGLAMYYRDVVVHNNVIYNAQAHGITVDEAVGVTITNNTLLHNPDSGDRGGISRPKIILDDDSSNVRVEHNITEAIVSGQPPAGAGWKIAHNLLVQNNSPSKPNYYDDLFANALAGGAKTGLEALQALPGSVIVKEGYGSSLTGGGGSVAFPEDPVGLPDGPAPAPEPEPEPEPGDLSFDLALAYDTGKLIDGDLTDGEVLALDDLDDGRLTLIATPSAGVGSVRLNLVGVHSTLENAAPYVLFGDAAGAYLPGKSLGAGDYEMVLTAYSGGNGSGAVLGSQTIAFSVAEEPASAPSPSPSPSPGAPAVYRWNAGPGTVKAIDGGPDWVADAGAVTGSARIGSHPGSSWTLDASVPASTPTAIFVDEYWGNSADAGMGLDFGDGALADGRYAVRLYMGDGYGGTDDPGERVFDVSVEGELFIDDLDLVAELGNQTGGMFEWQGTVDDGTIDIDFDHVVENPLINAVEIIRIDGTLDF